MSRFPFVFSILLSLFFLTVSACGVKAPPSHSVKVFTLKVEDLKSQWQDRDLYLSGYIKGLKESEKALDLVKGCRLYYAGYSSKAQPCTGCPIDYHSFHECGSEAISSNGLFMKVPKKIIGQVSFFKIRLIGPEGVVGPPSNAVRVDGEQE